jgi:hypothetical protein
MVEHTKCCLLPSLTILLVMSPHGQGQLHGLSERGTAHEELVESADAIQIGILCRQGQRRKRAGYNGCRCE